MIPRDTYKSIPPAGSIDTVPYDQWRELGADNVVIGTVQKVATGIRVELRLFNVRARQVVLGKEYTGSAANPRLYAHTMSDELHQSQRNLRGVARTKLAFSSDRNREAVVATVEKRDVKEIYVSDYDGANQRRITINRALNVFPSWSPDGRSIVYTSYRSGVPDLLISNIFAGTMEQPTKGVGQNWLPVFSPDGTRVAFVSSRDGNSEIYVINRDGSDLRRLTNNPAIDSTPTFSPTGTQIAFTSERTGTPQVYVINVDGSGHAPDLVRVVRGSGHLVARAVQRDRVFGANRTGIRHQDPEYRRRRRRARSRSARAPTRARPGRRTAVTWPSCRRARGAARSSRSIATAGTCGRSRATATTQRHTGRNNLRRAVQGLRSSMRRDANRLMVLAVMMTVMVGACGKKPAPVARPMPPPTENSTAGGPGKPPPPPTPVVEPPVVMPPMPTEDSIAGKSLDDLNRESPLKPLFFALDSSDVDAGRPEGAAGQRRDHEEVSRPGRSRSKATATSAARPNTTWRSANAARWRRRTTWCRWASPPTRSRSSATARSSRSIPATRMPRGRRTGGRIS